MDEKMLNDQFESSPLRSHIILSLRCDLCRFRATDIDKLFQACYYNHSYHVNTFKACVNQQDMTTFIIRESHNEEVWGNFRDLSDPLCA